MVTCLVMSFEGKKRKRKRKRILKVEFGELRRKDEEPVVGCGKFLFGSMLMRRVKIESSCRKKKRKFKLSRDFASLGMKIVLQRFSIYCLPVSYFPKINTAEAGKINFSFLFLMCRGRGRPKRGNVAQRYHPARKLYRNE